MRCYPAKEMLMQPIRAIYPALRACYQARTKKDAEGRVVFHFRVEQDGTIQRVCTGDARASTTRTPSVAWSAQ